MRKKKKILFKIKKNIIKHDSPPATPSRLDCRRLLLKHKIKLDLHITSILNLLKEMRLVFNDFQKNKFTKKDRLSKEYYIESLRFITLRNTLVEEIEGNYGLYHLFLCTNEVAPSVRTNIRGLLIGCIKIDFYVFETDLSFTRLEVIVFSYMKQLTYLLGLMSNVNRFELAIYEIPLTNRS